MISFDRNPGVLSTLLSCGKTTRSESRTTSTTSHPLGQLQKKILSLSLTTKQFPFFFYIFQKHSRHPNQLLKNNASHVLSITRGKTCLHLEEDITFGSTDGLGASRSILSGRQVQSSQNPRVNVVTSFTYSEACYSILSSSSTTTTNYTSDIFLYFFSSSSRRSYLDVLAFDSFLYSFIFYVRSLRRVFL